jgi:hypothetical protein
MIYTPEQVMELMELASLFDLLQVQIKHKKSSCLLLEMKYHILSISVAGRMPEKTGRVARGDPAARGGRDLI